MAYDPKKWTQHQCYPGFYILEQSFSHGSWRLSGNPSAAHRWEPPAGAHPSIQSIHASTESTHLSNSIHRFPSHNVPKYSLRIPGSWRWHRHGGKPSTPCSSGSSLSELDLGDKHSWTMLDQKARSIQFFWHFLGEPNNFSWIQYSSEL